jgi:acyl-CoA reductase-like NAD-dependent aldehyde dehydrogenase
LAARAIVFGLKLNQSRTCMRPHRIFVHESVRVDFTYELRRQMADIDVQVDAATSRRATRLVADAVRGRARVVNETTISAGLPDSVRFPVLLEDVPVFAEIASADIFAPILLLEAFTQVGHAIEHYDQSPYALGASVFGPQTAARELAEKLNAGFVVINDVIVPTADPRLPFSGRGSSGFGVTRGAEGLLELTQVKAISTRSAGYQHLEPAEPGDGALFAAFVEMVHGSTLRTRWQGMKKLVTVVRNRKRRAGDGRSGSHDSHR